MTDPPLRKSGRPALVSLLPSGEVRSAAVVRRLDMSVRTFTRNLAAKGMTFAEILKRVRQHLASGYLADNRKSVQQIARLLGYSNPGFFTHTYKRWTGISPKEARRQQPFPALSP
jgi:AraC-like DNA-binding protein